MKLSPPHALSHLVLFTIFLAGIPAEVSGKGGGGHGSSGHSSGSSSSKSAPVIIHTSHNTCVNQTTNQAIACPKSKLSPGVIAGIVIGSLVGVILIGVLLWFIAYRCLPKLRERRMTSREIPSATQQTVYQPVEGHVHPEGMTEKTAYAPSVSDSDTVIGEGEEKRMTMPEPEKGYLQV